MNQDWTLSLNLSKVRKLRDKLGLEIFNPAHYHQILESLVDRLAFVALLCEDQAKEIGVSGDEFEERLHGDGFVTRASLAFLRETADFFHSLGLEAMHSLATKAISWMESGQAKLDHLMKTGQLDSMMDRAKEEMERKFAENAGSSSLS